MKPNPWNLGACGVEQMIYAGSVKYNDTGIDEGIVVCDLPDNIVVTKAVAVVQTKQGQIETDVGEIKADVRILRERPVKWWDAVLSAVLGLVVGYALKALLGV